ncbi:MAG: hypothetical protein ACRDF4_03745, partial [Rhabdochlamydiaceae bacterium]
MHKVVFLLRGMWGLGHVTPSAAIAKELAAHGVSTYFLTYAHGVKFLRANGFRNVYDIGEPNHPSGIVQWKEMFEVNREILPLIKQIKPKVVVVDGECDALFLLR